MSINSINSTNYAGQTASNNTGKNPLSKAVKNFGDGKFQLTDIVLAPLALIDSLASVKSANLYDPQFKDYPPEYRSRKYLI
ncbi:hypothetical protein HP1_044 [Candidatus Termititenax spirochaetophilus]|uniref:Uncharacterized protein n=1 Tax=Candidatus Termititenax spirochaetophilus TaxID=2218522 RepID=A0A388T711_9BACT|nr:hypothetical protein HP1_044 [Candidatus Termititenax spirochaetophilus]